MKMKPDYASGDHLIKRVANGWLLVAVSENDMSEDPEPQVYVHEDAEGELGMHESLYNLLATQFECYLQTKRRGGIKMKFTCLSKEDEELR